MEDKIELQKFIINRLDTYIESSQSKSNLYIGLNTLILGGITTLIPSNHEYTCFQIILLGITASVSLISIFFTLLAISPYLKTKVKDNFSILFFKDIAKLKKEEYYKLITETSAKKQLKDFAEQTIEISKGLALKYKYLTIAGWLVGFQFLTFFIWTITFLIQK